ncbi:MAG TPA: hypothetical protein VL588_10375 [Bdellovibrionota bacterium]|nr:hypothetical protein [Bdellovibrionota bacterium]
MPSAILRFAKLIYRGSNEAQATPAGDRAKALLFLGGLVTLGLIFGGVYSAKLLQWNRFRPEVVTPSESWRAFYGDSPAPCGMTAGRGCLADPGTSILWESSFNRAQREHLAQTQTRRGQRFWIGTRVSPQDAARAAAAGANHLLVGWIRGTFRIWVNGQQMTEGTWADMEPVILTIPAGWLTAGRPVSVAVEILNDVELPNLPDLLMPGGEGGFMKKASAKAFKEYVDHWDYARPLALMTANLLLALFFFFGWTSDRRKTEYFYIAMCALVGAAIQFRATDYFFLSWSYTAFNRMAFLMDAYYSAFVLFLGLSFARVRTSVFKWGVPLALLLPAVIELFWNDSLALIKFRHSVSGIAVGVCAALGAAACFVQALYLKDRERKGLRLPERIRNLVAFGAAQLVLVPVSLLDDDRVLFTFAFQLLWRQSGHLAVLSFLGFIALADYKKERQLIEKVPISPYHRRPTLPESVGGALLVVDLKGSEALFRDSAQIGRSGELVEICLSHMWAAVVECGGVVLHTEGDALRALFDDQVHANPVLSAIRATDGIAAALERLGPQLMGKFHLEHEVKLGFRGGIALGQVRPVWQEMGVDRYASWIETGNGNPLVESTRVMDLERKVPETGPANSSRVVVLEDQAQALCLAMPELAVGFEARSLQLPGKHGKVYTVAAYRPGAVLGRVRAFKNVA